MQDFDLEELESRLYGQVFHSAPEQNVPEQAIPNSIPNQETASEEPRQVRQVSCYSVSNTLPIKNRYWNSNEPRNQVQVVINNEFIPVGSNSSESPTVIINNRIPVNVPKQNEVGTNNVINEAKNRRRNKKKRNKKNKQQFSANKYGNEPSRCTQCAYKFCVCNTPYTNLKNFNQDFPLDPILYVNRMFNNNLQMPGMVNPFPVFNPFYNNQQLPATPSNQNTRSTENNIEAKESVVIISDSDEDNVEVVPLPEKPPDPVYVIDSDSDVSIADDDSSKDDKVTDESKTEPVPIIETEIPDRNLDLKENIANSTQIVDNLNTSLNKNPNAVVNKQEIDINTIDNSPQKQRVLKEIEIPVALTAITDKSLNISNSKRTEIISSPESSRNDFIENDLNTDNPVGFNFNLHGSDLDLADKEFVKPKPVTYHPPIEPDIICTPDSSVNDFIDDSNDDSQFRFNFNLHGSDLDLTGREFVKPATISHPSDIYETESSCSGTGTPTKGCAYGDLVLNAPVRDIFHEADLTSFSNFITPNRENSKKRKKDVESLKQVETKALNALENKNITYETLDKTNLDVKKERKKEKRSKIKDDAINEGNEIIDNIGKPYENIQTNQNLNQEINYAMTKKKEKQIRFSLLNFENQLKRLTEMQNFTNSFEFMRLQKQKKRIKKKHKRLTKKLLMVSSGVNINNKYKIQNNVINTTSEPTNIQPNEYIDVENNSESDCNDSEEEPIQNEVIKDNTEEINEDSNNEEINVTTCSSDEDINVTEVDDNVDFINAHVPELVRFENNQTDLKTDDKSSNEMILNVSPVMSTSCTATSDKATPSTSKTKKSNLVVNPFHEGPGKKSFKDFWTLDMEAFYDESWGQEDYDLKAVIQSMTRK